MDKWQAPEGCFEKIAKPNCSESQTASKQALIFKRHARPNQTKQSENKQGQQVKRPSQQPRKPPRRAEKGINIFEVPSLPVSGPQT